MSCNDIDPINPMNASDIMDLTPYLSVDCDMIGATLYSDIPRHAGDSNTANLLNFGELGVTDNDPPVAAHFWEDVSSNDIDPINPMNASDITDLTPYLSADGDMIGATLYSDIPRHAGDSNTANLLNFGELGVTDNDSPVAAHSHEEMLSRNWDTIFPTRQMFEELKFDKLTLTNDQLPSTPPRNGACTEVCSCDLDMPSESQHLYDDFLYYYIE